VAVGGTEEHPERWGVEINGNGQMATPRQPGLKGSPRSRPGDNLDSGAPSDGREIAERAREGRSRKAADNASIEPRRKNDGTRFRGPRDWRLQLLYR